MTNKTFRVVNLEGGKQVMHYYIEDSVYFTSMYVIVIVGVVIVHVMKNQPYRLNEDARSMLLCSGKERHC